VVARTTKKNVKIISRAEELLSLSTRKRNESKKKMFARELMINDRNDDSER